MVDKLYLIKFKKIEIIYSENQIRRWSSQDMILGKFNTLSIRIFPRWDVDDRFSIIRKGKITRDALESSVANEDRRRGCPFYRPVVRRAHVFTVKKIMAAMHGESTLNSLHFLAKCLDDIARKNNSKRIKRSFVNIFVFFFLFPTTRIVKFKIKKKKNREKENTQYLNICSLCLNLNLATKKKNLKSFEVEDNILTIRKRERIKINIKKADIAQLYIVK